MHNNYIEDPNHCPYCGSSELYATEPTHPKPHQVIQLVECGSCEEKWKDIYSLTSIEPVPQTEEDF